MKKIWKARRCVICRKHYLPKHYNAVVCSEECRKIHREKRRKEYKYTYGWTTIRWQILTRDNFTCQYCGRKAPDVELHIDHIIPKSKGGTNESENLVVACAECNIGKADNG